ncbi:TIGR01440 family protein [Cohnella thermotolerans]|jgi:uncharacterized protein (TIGR01440 family)|uniref:TIGR01440 family protein n=1 Tax=Cohnella thermotolerans TaxID=329858 RepID=UPI000406F5AF|nr:TIGR01440 family protein [Cohnella thermotolerans]
MATQSTGTPERPPIADQVERALTELIEAGRLRKGQIVVFGCSTSEVQGARIGTSGAEEIAERIYEGVERVRARVGFHAAWQCCEHLNRALVVSRELAEAKGWTVVSAVPVRKAGGSMAAYAYRRLTDPCLVESLQADAGFDIGETLIGMHLRPVAVPVRPSVPWIGEARLTMAYSRPKLIGGERAVYALPERDAPSSGSCD